MSSSLIICVATAIAAIAVTIGVATFVLIKNIKLYRKNSNSSEITTLAEIVSARKETIGSYSKKRGTVRCFVTFKLESGDTVVLSAEEEEGKTYSVGDRGLLVFRGTRIISFSPIEKQN